MLKSFGLEKLACSHGHGAMIRSRRAAPPLGVKSTKSLGKSNVENSLADLRELENLEESEAQPLAPDRLREFLKDSCGSVLRAWAHVFDSNNDQRISREEFKSGLKKLNFNGENAAMKLFNLLDKDSSGEITLEEIDLLSDRKWRAFRQYCVKRFQSVEDLMQQLASLAMAFEDGSEVDTKKKPRVESLSKVEFMLGMINSGWPGEDKELEEVWMALRDASDDMMRVSGRDGPGLAWFGIEMRRFNRKKAAKIKSKQWFALRSRQGLNPAMIQKCFEEFKTSLRKKHGNLIRAWRQELSTNDAMSIAKVKFLRAAAKLGWSREAKDLWRALDKDESGTASLDELDPVGAEILANFKVWVDSEFGGIRNAFRKIDEDNTKTISVKEFEKALRTWNFPRATKQVFHMLDKDANGKLEMDDVIFLEKWQPLEFLLVHPDHKAKEEFKELLLAKMTRYLKGWKRILDKDNTNRCNWYEFQEACRVLGFRGNIGGAWRAFDEDLSGYISLKELDENASKVLLGFRRWAIAEFGSVRQLFTTFDKDKSNSLSFLEWRGALKVYGYDGPSRELFQALDVGGEGSLSVKEVDFLDDWSLDMQEDVSPVLLNTDSVKPGLSPRPSWDGKISEERVNFARRASMQTTVKSRAVKLLDRSMNQSPREESSSSSESEAPADVARRWQTRSPMEVIISAKKVVPKKSKTRFCFVQGSVVEQAEEVRTLRPEELQGATKDPEAIVAVKKDLSLFDFSMDTAADDSLERLSRMHLAKALDFQQVAASARAATAPAESMRGLHSLRTQSRRTPSKGLRDRVKRKKKKQPSFPSLDQLLSTANCGPAQLSSMLLKDRGKVGSCGASRNIKIS